MVAHETQVRRYRAQAVPAGKGGDLDDDACELPRLLDVGIDRLADLREVFLGQRRLRPEMQDALCGVEAVVNHDDSLLIRSQIWLRYSWHCVDFLISRRRGRGRSIRIS